MPPDCVSIAVMVDDMQAYLVKAAGSGGSALMPPTGTPAGLMIGPGRIPGDAKDETVPCITDNNKSGRLNVGEDVVFGSLTMNSTIGIMRRLGN